MKETLKPFFKHRFKVYNREEKEGIERSRRLILSFENQLGKQKAERFWKTLQTDRLRYWHKKEIERYNAQNDKNFDANSLLKAHNQAFKLFKNEYLGHIRESIPNLLEVKHYSKENFPLIDQVILEEDRNGLNSAYKLIHIFEYYCFLLEEELELDKATDDLIKELLKDIQANSTIFGPICALMINPNTHDYDGTYRKKILNLISSYYNQNHTYLTYSGILMSGLLRLIGNLDPSFLFDSLSNIESLLNSVNSYERYKRERLFDPRLEPVEQNINELCNSIFSNQYRDKDKANRLLLKYGYQSIKTSPSQQSKTNSITKYRRIKSADFFLNRIETTNGQEWITKELYDQFCDSLFDVSPAVRLQMVKIHKLIGKAESISLLKKLALMEKSSRMIRKEIENSIKD